MLLPPSPAKNTLEISDTEGSGKFGKFGGLYTYFSEYPLR